MDVPVVVAVDEQHRRRPVIDVGHRRRVPRDDKGFGAVALLEASLEVLQLVRDVGRPVVDAVQVHARLEQVRVAREAERRQQPAVRTAPDADPRRVHARGLLQETTARHDILVLGRPGRAGMLGVLEVVAVTDSQAVVDRQHDEAVRGQVLVHRVGVAVVAHVRPAEHHLPGRSAVHEDDARLPGGAVLALEQLPVDEQAVGRAKGDPLRDHEAGPREFRRGGLAVQDARPRRAEVGHGDRTRPPGVGTHECEGT